jgi:predicted dehydrogenase
MPLARKLRFGMVGGGPGAFIGAVHRRAATYDGLAELVAGAFSADADKSKAQGRELFLDEKRVYSSYQEMADREAGLPPDRRIDFVSIVTPNHLHVPIASAFVERGINVVCDKPLSVSLEDSEALCKLVAKQGVTFALTHNYSGYPLVKHARDMVRNGELGKIRKIVAEYSQGWLSTLLEATGSKQADWRTDPVRAGAGAIGDIGSHAEHLARYVTGLGIDRLFADVSTFVEGRRIDDDANMLLNFTDGAKGLLFCSQISIGEENRLSLRVYGTEGAIEWLQEDPNFLYVRRPNGPMTVLKPGHPFLSPAARHATRLPSGHPESFPDAFANIYSNAIRTMSARIAGEEPNPLDLDFPTVQDGAIGVHFIKTSLESGRRGGWVDARYTPPR